MRKFVLNLKSILLLCFTLIALFVVLWFSLRPEFTITKPYDYPVKPGSEEWKTFSTTAARVAVSQIPEDVLSKMTTEALLDTVLNYPFMINLFAFSTPEQGYNSVYNSFNGLRELTKRPNVLEVLERYQEEASSSLDELKPVYMKAILKAVSTK